MGHCEASALRNPGFSMNMFLLVDPHGTHRRKSAQSVQSVQSKAIKNHLEVLYLCIKAMFPAAKCYNRRNS